jgi:hypothetical protein
MAESIKVRLVGANDVPLEVEDDKLKVAVEVDVAVNDVSVDNPVEDPVNTLDKTLNRLVGASSTVPALVSLTDPDGDPVPQLADADGRAEVHEREADEGKGYSGTTSNVSVGVAIDPPSKTIIISNDHASNSMDVSLNGGETRNWIELKAGEVIKLHVRREIIYVKSTAAGAHVPYRIIVTDIYEAPVTPPPSGGS